MQDETRRPSAFAVFCLAPLLMLAAAQRSSAEQQSRVCGVIPIVQATATSFEEGFPPAGAIDGDRFSNGHEELWKGSADKNQWHWEADFGTQMTVGAILQIVGDDQSTLTSAPLSYVWQFSHDCSSWHELPSTRVDVEHRMYRVHRLPAPVRARYLRLLISKTNGAPPALREIEVYDAVDATIDFPDWFFAVSSEDGGKLTTCHQFLDLAKRCDGWSDVTSQYLPHADFNPSIVLAEPRPLCAFFTGSYRDWCEVDRASWRGVEAVLDKDLLPMWGACGGAQAFGILADTGCDEAWDCPKCRDPRHPKLPIYGHIGLVDPTRSTLCGDYSNSVYEIGPTPLRKVRDDPVLRDLPQEFVAPEYHCGQLEYLPEGWELIVTKGDGAKTWMQCMRKRRTLIYAAQFHIELDGTPEVSRTIMSNFLSEAKAWSDENHVDASASRRSGADSSNQVSQTLSATQATE